MIIMNHQKIIIMHDLYSALRPITSTAKTVNGSKTKLERERAKKMGLFWTDVCWTSRPQRDSGAAVLKNTEVLVASDEDSE